MKSFILQGGIGLGIGKLKKIILLLVMFGAMMLVLAGCVISGAEKVTVYIQNGVLGPDDRFVIRYTDGTTVTSGVYEPLTDDDLEFFGELNESDFSQYVEYLVKFEVDSEPDKAIAGLLFTDGTHYWSPGIPMGANVPLLYPLAEAASETPELGSHPRFMFMDPPMYWGKPENIPAYAVLEAVEPTMDFTGNSIDGYQTIRLKIYDAQGALVEDHAEVYGFSNTGSHLRKTMLNPSTLVMEFWPDIIEGMPESMSLASTGYLSAFTVNGEVVFAVESDAPSETKPWTILSDSQFELYYGDSKLPIHWNKVDPESVSFDKISPSDVTVNIVNAYSQNDVIEGLLVDGEAVDTDDYTLNQSGSESVLTLKEDFLVALDNGEHVFTICWESGHELQFTVIVDGPEPVVLSVSVTPESASVAQGGSLQLTATVEVEYGADKTVTWTSSDAGGKVSVDATGKVTVAADAEPGVYTITATSNYDDSKSASATITVTEAEQQSPPPYYESDGPSSPAAAGGSTGDEGVYVLVNGKMEYAGKAENSERSGRSVTTVTVDQDKLDEKLAEEGQGAIVTIPVNTQSDIVIGELNGQMIRNMQDKQAVVQVQTEQATYTIPAEQISINAISGQFGNEVSLQDIKVQIEISAPNGDTVQWIENEAENRTFTVVVPPLDFSVRATYGDTTIDVTKFTEYVERMIAIPDGVDPDKITTGVVVEADGTVRHVPTQVKLIDGKYYAVINSLTNSTYTVIWHPVEFADMANHWATSAVNEMGSRMVVEGTGEGMFTPDREITRAEFAAIVVRGLGLKPESGTTSFSDVKASDWYSGAVRTASEYGLINGYADGTFRPNDLITREQAIAIIAKAMKLTGLKDKLGAQSSEAALRPFADAAEVAAWAKDGAADAVSAGIIAGRSANQLAPKGFVTRAEAAALIQRLLEKSELI
jgi:hypothetical protein